MPTYTNKRTGNTLIRVKPTRKVNSRYNINHTTNVSRALKPVNDFVDKMFGRIADITNAPENAIKMYKAIRRGDKDYAKYATNKDTYTGKILSTPFVPVISPIQGAINNMDGDMKEVSRLALNTAMLYEPAKGGVKGVIKGGKAGYRYGRNTIKNGIRNANYVINNTKIKNGIGDAYERGKRGYLLNNQDITNRTTPYTPKEISDMKYLIKYGTKNFGDRRFLLERMNRRNNIINYNNNRLRHGDFTPIEGSPIYNISTDAPTSVMNNTSKSTIVTPTNNIKPYNNEPLLLENKRYDLHNAPTSVMNRHPYFNTRLDRLEYEGHDVSRLRQYANTVRPSSNIYGRGKSGAYNILNELITRMEDNDYRSYSRGTAFVYPNGNIRLSKYFDEGALNDLYIMEEGKYPSIDDVPNEAKINYDFPFNSDRKGASYFNMTPRETIVKAMNDMNELKAKKQKAAWHLTHDSDTSTDSYRLQAHLFNKYSDDGKPMFVKNPDGSIKYQRINGFGKYHKWLNSDGTVNQRNVDAINEYINSLAKKAGLKESPTVKVGVNDYDHYAPSIYFRFNERFGGNINKRNRIFKSRF